jgi:hypothetical protein
MFLKSGLNKIFVVGVFLFLFSPAFCFAAETDPFFTAIETLLNGAANNPNYQYETTLHISTSSTATGYDLKITKPMQAATTTPPELTVQEEPLDFFLTLPVVMIFVLLFFYFANIMFLGLAEPIMRLVNPPKI